MTEDTPKAPPFVMVLWEDIKQMGETGVWVENKSREYIPHLFCTLGFVIKDVPEGIHIVGTWSQDITSPPDQIPRGVIRSIIPLISKPARKRST